MSWPGVLAICLHHKSIRSLQGAGGAPHVGWVTVAPSPDAALKPGARGGSLQGTGVTSGGDT